MKPVNFLRMLALSTSLLGFSQSSWSLPIFDLRIDDLIAKAGEIKQTLNLNENQKILWQQVEVKSARISRERQARRERLQASVTKELADSKTELRDLVVKINTESDAIATEDKAMRELWLTINDALNENQRIIVANFFNEQLQRIPDMGHEKEAGRKINESGSHNRPGSKRKSNGNM